MKCCVCKRIMRKFHFTGKALLFPTFINDDLDLEHIEFPQPFCKKCKKAFKEWLVERNIFM